MYELFNELIDVKPFARPYDNSNVYSGMVYYITGDTVFTVWILGYREV